jgi:hypothetical protein
LSIKICDPFIRRIETWNLNLNCVRQHWGEWYRNLSLDFFSSSLSETLDNLHFTRVPAGGRSIGGMSCHSRLDPSSSQNRGLLKRMRATLLHRSHSCGSRRTSAPSWKQRLCKKLVKNSVFWDVTPCGTCRIRRDSYHPEDGGDMFLRNVGSYKNHTA